MPSVVEVSEFREATETDNNLKTSR